MSDSKKSLLEPVGIAQAMQGTNGGFTMAVFQASQVPVDCELYVQPKDSRLRLEVEIANENALHWKDGLSHANERCAQLRTDKFRLMDRVKHLGNRADRLSSELQKARLMLLNLHDSLSPSSYSDDIREFLFKGSK